MGVFQRKADQSMTSPLRTNLKRRSGVDRRRFTHPTAEINGLDTEKWPPTLNPGPEVVEADLDDNKASVKAREFSAWTPDGLPGKRDGSEFIVSAPNLMPTSRPLSQGSKPLPAKKPPLPQKPGLPQKPLVPGYRPVLPNQVNPLGIVLSDPGIPSVPPPKPRLRSAKDPYAKRKAKFEQKPKLAPITESDSRRSSQASASSGNRNSGVVQPVTLVEEPDKDVDTMSDQAPIIESDHDDDVDDSENDESLNSIEHKMETNQIPVQQTSTTTSTTASPTDDNGYVSYNDLAQDSGILPFRGPTASPFSSTENLREDPSLSRTEPDTEDDKKSIYENVILRRDGSVESLIDPGKTQRPPKPKPLGPPLPERDFNVQTDMDTYANFRIDVQNIDNTKKSIFNVSDAETKDTGVGPDPSDNLGGLENKGFKYDEDFQLELESVTDLLDEVVFGKGRSTQTGDSLRLGNDRTNLVIQKINMINERQQQAQQSRPRPISDCTVVDSGTSMDDLDPDPLPPPVSTKVVMRHQQQQQQQQHEEKVDIDQPNLDYEPVQMHRTRDSIRTIEPPPMMPQKVDMRIGSDTTESILSSLSDDVPKRRNGKMCIGMSIIFTVIILGIIAAGVIIYFVVQQMDSNGTGDQSIKAYYVGIKLNHTPYTSDLEDAESDKYKFVGLDICTYVQEAMTDASLFKTVYKSCGIMDFRAYKAGGTGIAAHVKMVFLKEKIELIQENDASPVIGTIEFYLKEYLRKGFGTSINNFRNTYGPAIDDIIVVQYWNQLSEFGTKPAS